MNLRLGTRDRALMLFVLWPAALLAAALWVVSPMAEALAAGRGILEQKRAELQQMQVEISGSDEVAKELTQLQSDAEQLGRFVLRHERSVEAVVAMRALFQAAGLTMQTTRVGEVEQPRRDVKKPEALPFLTVEASARGFYQALLSLLREWSAGTVPLKVVRLEAIGDEETAGVQVKVLVRAFLRAAPQGQIR